MAEPTDRDWEALNAYADGELDGASRAALARRLAHDPALAARLAEVHAAKAALSLLRPRAQAALRPRRFVPDRRVALAASLALALGLGALYQSGDAQRDWREVPADFHAAFSEAAYVLPDRPQQAVVSVPHVGDVPVPDLSPARLFLVDVAIRRLDEREIVAMHYRGRNGCRVTLAAIEARPGEAPPEITAPGLADSWTGGGLHYVLLGGGMDRERFAAIRDFARAESRHAPPGELRMAMRAATLAARPCA